MRNTALPETHQPSWHLLQVSDALDEEFGSALAEQVPLLAWKPERHFLPLRGIPNSVAVELPEPRLTVHTFPLLRGFARFPLTAIARTGTTVSEHLLRHTTRPAESPLICTSPYFAPVAERWPGPVVYWLTDLMARYKGVHAEAVYRLDARMCRVATLVCPNSRRLAEYLMERACPPDKLEVLPNATRACNLLPSPALRPGCVPDDMRRVRGAIAGVIGNLAGNMDWSLLAEMVNVTWGLQWVFVGPTNMPIENRTERQARAYVMTQPNTLFVGKKPYGALASYARAFDVAVLPYRRCEPTYSGSSTRFYEHLAACRPMIATRGFEELLHKEPLLRLFDTARQGKALLDSLQQRNFDDGLASARWKASQQGTWQVRAACMIRALRDRRRARTGKADAAA